MENIDKNTKTLTNKTQSKEKQKHEQIKNVKSKKTITKCCWLLRVAIVACFNFSTLSVRSSLLLLFLFEMHLRDLK